MPSFSELIPENLAASSWQTGNPSGGNPFAPRGLPVQDSPDLQRILALPRRKVLVEGTMEAEAMIEYEMSKYGRKNDACRCAEIDPQIAAGRRGCITRLHALQAQTLYELGTQGGFIGSLFAGWGKGIISVLAILALPECRLGLLLVPPTLLEQFIRDYKLVREHFRVPGVVVHMSGKKDWSAVGEPGEPAIHVLPYSGLSSEHASDWIDHLEPDLIIADELDSVSDQKSARTLRLFRHFSGPDEMPKAQRIERLKKLHFCGWTGSLTDKSILEYAALTVLALRDKSPLPMDPQVAQEWALCLDASPNPCPAGALSQLCQGEETAREGFRRRLSETPGFLITTESDVIVAGGTEAIHNDIVERKAPEIPEIIQKALKMVADFKRPDTLDGNSHDEELEGPLEQAKCAAEISTGMFYKWIFPRGESPDVIDAWFAARRDWHSEQREKKLRGEKYLDSNKLCESAAMRAWGHMPQDPQRPEWKAESWPRWREVRDTVKPQPKAVRLHPFLVEDAAQWGLENRGIIWYQMVEFGQWCSEVSGLKIYGGGSKDYKRLVAETGEQSIILSIKSRGRGFDGLQHLYDHQLVANVPSSSRIFQQLLRRIIRRGQRSASTLTELYQHTQAFRKSLDQAKRRAEYVFETMGEKQTLLSGWRG